MVLIRLRSSLLSANTLAILSLDLPLSARVETGVNGDMAS